MITVTNLSTGRVSTSPMLIVVDSDYVDCCDHRHNFRFKLLTGVIIALATDRVTVTLVLNWYSDVQFINEYPSVLLGC